LGVHSTPTIQPLGVHSTPHLSIGSAQQPYHEFDYEGDTNTYTHSVNSPERLSTGSVQQPYHTASICRCTNTHIRTHMLHTCTHP
jgi:hypothetical protein